MLYLTKEDLNKINRTGEYYKDSAKVYKVRNFIDEIKYLQNDLYCFINYPPSRSSLNGRYSMTFDKHGCIIEVQFVQSRKKIRTKSLQCIRKKKSITSQKLIALIEKLPKYNDKFTTVWNKYSRNKIFWTSVVGDTVNIHAFDLYLLDWMKVWYGMKSIRDSLLSKCNSNTYCDIHIITE
jgi:REP element-mobilizing transposase RayT